MKEKERKEEEARLEKLGVVEEKKKTEQRMKEKEKRRKLELRMDGKYSSKRFLQEEADRE
jgi:hypothetical protein